MKSNLLFLLLFVTVAITSCKSQDPIELIEPTPEEDLGFAENVVWQIILFADSTEANSIVPEVYNDNIVFSSFSYNQPKEIFRMFNGSRGDVIWERDDPECIGIPNGAQANSNNKLALCDGNNIHVFDLDTGSELWQSADFHNGLRLAAINENVFWTNCDKGFKPDTCTLMRSDFEMQDWKKVFTLTKTNGYTPSIEPPVSWKNPSDETILIFQNRSYNFDIGDGRIDLYSYNLDQQVVEWKKEDISESGNSSIYPSIVSDDKVYFPGMNSIHCYDISTGELVWERLFPGAGFLRCNMIIADGRLVANGDAQNLWALDLNTGETIWNNTTIKSHNSGNMVHYNGIIYFNSEGNGTLCAVKLSDGSTIWEERSPNANGWNQNGFKSGLAINEELGYLYTIDGYYAMCIKLPE